MIHKDFKNLKLPALGFGTMRLPVIGGDDSKIDEKATEEMVAYAMEHGVNYFDTAWIYHNGNSETVMGKILGKYPRESWFLADKFPGFKLSNLLHAKKIFEKQLERCAVDYFDFYLFHNVCEANVDAYLDTYPGKKFGLHNYLMSQKEIGRIRHLGFSAHGGYDVLKRFLDAYGDSMEFALIQINYLDWTFQNAKAKVELLKEYDIPIWVMEPMRGGQLAALSDEDAAKLRAYRSEEKAPAWALRFIQSIPNVAVTLTGASSFEQLKANIETLREEKPLSTNEFDALTEIAAGMIKKTTVSCTSCRYCLSSCPKQLDIPYLLNLYNEHNFTISSGGLGFIAPMALKALPKGKHPKSCTACGECEAVCPQQIKISSAIADFIAKL